MRLILASIALAQGDIQLSHEIYLSAEPRWLEPDQWPVLIDSRNYSENQTGCIVAWLFMNAGDQELGAALLQQATAFIEDSLPLMTERPDQFLNRSQFARRLSAIQNGSQHTSHDWQNFLKANNLQASMSRRGNCHDNAVAESFFQLLKREQIKRHIYSTRDDARTDIVEYIEMFYNSKRRHSFNDLLSPVEYEKKFTERLASV